MVLIVAALSAWQQHSIRRQAAYATGRVVNVIPRRNAAGSVRYAPVVRYTDAQGTHHDFTASAQFSPRSYKAGETVNVLYSPLNPESAEVDTWQLQWARAILFAAGAVALLALGSILRSRGSEET